MRPKLPHLVTRTHRRAGREYTYHYYVQSWSPRKEVSLGSNWAEAVQKWAELERVGVSDAKASAITLQFVWEHYRRADYLELEPRTQKDYEVYYKSLATFFGEDAPFPRIETKHLQLFKEWRAAKVRFNRERALFSVLWRYAKSRGWVQGENPVEGVRTHTELGRDIYVRDEVVAAVLDVADEPLKRTIRLAYLTAQRPADVLRLSVRSVQDGYLVTRPNKTQKSSRLKLRIAITGELKELVDVLIADPLRTRPKVKSIALLLNEHGRALTYPAVRKRFDRARLQAEKNHPELAAEIREYQLRDMRAKAGTDVEEKRGMSEAKGLLGHTTETMTARYVRHRLGKKVEPTK